jgi:hypothetical protein
MDGRDRRHTSTTRTPSVDVHIVRRADSLRNRRDPNDPMSNPFVRADAWRAHPLLNKPWGHAFPGLALGAALFAGYVAMDKAKTATAAKSAAKSGGGESGR